MGVDANTGIVSPLSLLKNPMILIAGVSMLIVFGMPYLMDNSTSCSAPLWVLFTDFAMQWIRNSVLNLKSVRNPLRSGADRLRTHCKISMLRLGWRALAVRERRRVKALRGWWRKREELRDKDT
jgi:hypothetical protein